MIRKFLGAFAILLSISCVANAALIGSFDLVQANKTTNPLVYPNPFDTYVFNVNNTGAGNVEALELSFHGAFLQTSGNTSVQQTAANPLVFGFEAPETFFVTRASIAPADVLVAPGTLVDTAEDFRVSYTVAGGPSLLSGGETKAIAFFSVAAGTELGASNFVSGQAAIGGQLNGIVFGGVPNLAPIVDDGGLIPVQLDSINNPPALTTAMHQFIATDDAPLSELIWALDSFTGPGVLNGATLDANGLLSWVADGSQGGLYTATVHATDAGGLSDVGMVTFQLTVPEPTSIALFGLALVGFAGFRRK